MKHQRLKLFVAGLAMMAIFQITGCEYSKVGTYSTRDNTIKINVLDPNECDFARNLKLEISAFGKEHEPVDFQQLDCSILFKRDEFKVFEHPNGQWVFFMTSDTEEANDEVVNNSIWVIFDRTNNKLFTDQANFPQTALDILKSKQAGEEPGNTAVPDKNRAAGTENEQE